MRFTVGTRILLGFGLALVILAIVGGVSYRSTIALIDNAEWVAHSHRVIEALENVIAQVTNAETGQRGFLLTGRDRYLEPYHTATEGLEARMAELRRMTADNPDQQHRLDRLAPFIADKFAELQQTISLRQEKSAEAALEIVLTDRGKLFMDGIRKQVAEMQNEENKLLKVRAEESKSSAQTTTSTILFGSLAAFVLVGVSSVLIQRSITRPLGRFVEFVDRVGKGDLTQQATITNRDEVGRLGEGINEMVTGLKGMSGQIMSVSERMNAAAAEILASTQQQAAGTKEQAATIQQITATMEEVRQSGAQISERAMQVTVTAEASASITVTGLTTVQEANHTMEAIRQQVEEVAENVVSLSEKTQAVGEIIATVNDIAERSNLLALNAAIEAAAAGDQGSRFSVVANEIKNLADQAKESTVQVRTILGDIQKRINSSVMLTEEAVKRTETGKQQADVTEDTIRRMADTTQESVQAFQQIISATRQQQIGFEQVTQGMQDIGQAASQTAAGTVQLEKAVASLNAQSHQLREAVGRYQDLMDINQQLLAAFKVEHVEHLEGIRSCLAQWEQDGGTPDVNEAFRRAHSLKGAARVTGLLPIEALAHQLESLFALLRAKPRPVDGEVLHGVRAALDAIEDAAAALLEGRQPADASRLLAELNELLTSESETDARTHVRTANPSAMGRASQQPGAGPDPLPIVRSAGGTAIAESGRAPRDGRGARPASASTKTAVHASGTQAPETVRLSTVNLDRLLLSTSQLLTESLKQDSLARELSAIQQRLAVVEREWEALKRAKAGPLRRLSSSPELAAVAGYIELVEHEFGGLSRRIRGARLLQQRSSWSVRQLSEQLQADVRHARMVPAESEFQSFRKMLRDLARDQQKELEFRVQGFDVLADRMVLQALKDPLMHVLRNAVTHGIESPDQRTRRGKPPAGLVTLTIRAVGKRLTIEVDDDGCGINLAEVSELAVGRGLLSAAEAALRSEAELTELLFQPGFSTSRTVTELSGRGMGLSAAYEAVNRLQGQIELKQRADAGATILITMPLSISTHRLLLVACRGQMLAIPFYGIEGLHHVKPHDVQSVEGIPMVALGGQLTPLTGLVNLLDHSQSVADIGAGTLCLAVLRCSSKRVAVAVDAFAAEQNALIQNLGPPADTMSLYLGGILLEDGSVSPVLNPAELVDRFKPLKKAALPREPDREPHCPTILVVDDSFTTRTLETSILEANGFRVRVAVDGVEALEQLRAEKMDLVISDIQMPRLDGFGLLAEMKRDPRLARIPVIVVSSVDGSEDQERGLSLGADAYIVKRRFDHQELLKAVRQLL